MKDADFSAAASKDGALLAISLSLSVCSWFLLHPGTFWERLISLIVSMVMFVAPWYLNYLRENEIQS